jgi:hypothetical protein
MENKKLTQEELDKIQELQQKNQALVNELGAIELARLSVEGRRKNAEAFLDNLRKEEEELAKSLSETYGTGSIDLANGEFVPAPEQEEAPAAE